MEPDLTSAEESARRRRGRIWLVLIVAVMLGATAYALYANLTRGPAAIAVQGQALERLEIRTAGGPQVFQVEVMRNDEDRARGLMHRRHMPADRGMLFDFKQESPITMWMKNTYISLDMVFIRRDGTIHRIEERTETLSERAIEAGAPVLSVLEINAGAAARLGIKPGDKVVHSLFGR